MKDHYCTYFDHRYAAQGLALINSLRAQGADGPVWVLCLDDESEKLVKNFSIRNLKVVSISQIENHFPGLSDARSDRSALEYYYTMTPHIIRYVFDKDGDASRVAYVDGDMYFFGPVQEMWNATVGAPVAIIPHNFSKGAKRLLKYGTYNVGWVSFTRNEQGMSCLDFWKRSCRDWCRSEVNEGRFADQGYLDRFIEFAPDLAIVQHKGCNLGPWNVGSHDIWINGKEVYVDDDPLIFFHFSGFKQGLKGKWYDSHRFYRTRMTRIIHKYIYREYFKAFVAARRQVAELSHYLDVRPNVPLQPYRGGGSNFKAQIFMIAQSLFQRLDLVTGRAFSENIDLNQS